MTSHRKARSNSGGAVEATVIATLPPPTTGMTGVTKRTVARLQERGSVKVINLSTGGAARRRGWKLVRSLRQVKTAFQIVAGKAGEGNIYIALNSGVAVALDAMLVAAARSRRRRVFVHHHSFRHLNSPSRLLKAVYWLGKESVTDVVLCDRMAELLHAAYGRTDSWVVPNLSPIPAAVAESISSETLRLGHLSNLSLAKGVGRSLEAFEEANGSGLNVQLHLAGPFADDEAGNVVTAAVAEWPGKVVYHGAVYGEQKDAFYASLDLFLYPTAYNVEAQPLVLLEALGAGVPIVSVSRGCIDSLSQDAAGESVTICPMAEFSSTVAEMARNALAGGAAKQAVDRMDARATSQSFAEHAAIALDHLVSEILEDHKRYEPVGGK